MTSISRTLNYPYVRRLAEGFGLCQDRTTTLNVAIHVLANIDPQFNQNLAREVEALKGLKNDRTIAPIEVFTEDDITHVVYQFFPEMIELYSKIIYGMSGEIYLPVLDGDLGAGTSSSVHRYISSSGDVALKEIKRSACKKSVENLEREIKSLIKLKDNSNIINLIDAFENNIDSVLVFEYLPQMEELFDFISKYTECFGPPLPPEIAMKIFEQLVKVIRYLHDHGIVHRDLKPENILVDPVTSQIKLIDFGMSREVPESTLVTTSCGSPHYVAPEIACGKEYDPRKSDLWSLGVVLYVLATSSLPFYSENTAELLRMIMSGNFTIPPQINSISGNPKPLEPEIIYLIKGLLKVDPTKRLTLSKVERKIRRFWRDFIATKSPSVLKSKTF